MRERCHGCWNLIQFCNCHARVVHPTGWSETCGPVPWFDDPTQPVDLRAEFKSGTWKPRTYVEESPGYFVPADPSRMGRLWVALDLEDRFYAQHLQN